MRPVAGLGLGHECHAPQHRAIRSTIPSSLDALFKNTPQLTRSRDDSPRSGKMAEEGAFPIGFVGGFSSWHPTASNFLSATARSGSSRTSIDRRVYQLLGHRADGEPISDDAF